MEVVDGQSDAIRPSTASPCQPIVGSGTKAEVVRKGGADLSAMADRPVRFRFLLHRGSLYSFQTSDSVDGRSKGYLAAGDPGPLKFRIPILLDWHGDMITPHGLQPLS